MGLKDIYREFHSKTKEYIFSAPRGTFSGTDHIINHKTSINRNKKIEIIPYIQLDNCRLRLDFNNNKNNRKPTYPWKVSNALFSDNSVREEIKKLKTFWNLIKMMTQHTQT